MATPVRIISVDKDGKPVVTVSDENGRIKTSEDARREYDEAAREQVREEIRKKENCGKTERGNS